LILAWLLLNNMNSCNPEGEAVSMADGTLEMERDEIPIEVE